ncbi:protein kinase [Streptomyces sp. NPDC090036]|uniref:protein kinase domain-containing protein n=1 Tax=Streptomyces sp. NPDC090036 TaxID=3365926 RepID=UPI00381454DF
MRVFPWIVMEFITGPSLASLVRAEGSLGRERIAALGEMIADALAHAHAAGVVHRRDLKPDNVLVAGESPVATDFGIARILDATQHLTGTNTVIGTPQYMPPEQLEGRRVGASADMWALGATLYTAVEGRPPFDGSTLTAVITAVLTQPAPSAVRTGALADLLGELLSKDPARRPDAVSTRARPDAARSAAPSAVAAGHTPTVRVQAPAVTADVAALASAPTATAPAVPALASSGPRRRGVLLGVLAAVGAASGTVITVRQFADHDAPSAKNRAGDLWSALTVADSTVTSLAYSPDGRLLAVGCQDGTVRLCDTTTRTLAATLATKAEKVRHLLFSPDGRTLAVSGDDDLLMWDTATGTLTAAQTGDRGWLNVLAYSPDRKTLAIGGERGRGNALRLWTPGSSKGPAVIEILDGAVESVAFTPDGRSVISESKGKNGLRLTDLANPAGTATTVLGQEIVQRAAISPDGGTIAAVIISDPHRQTRVVVPRNPHPYHHHRPQQHPWGRDPGAAALQSRRTDAGHRQCNTVRLWPLPIQAAHP